MALQITIPDQLAKGLEERAVASGTSAEQLALAAIERALASSPLDELLAPVRAAYDDSGITEDESFEFLEAEKHAMRHERHTGTQ